MEEQFKQFKFKPILGAMPGYGSEWWTEEQWEKHRAYVEQLKAEGRYLTEGEEITINYKSDAFKMFEDNEPFGSKANARCMFLVPNGAVDKK